MDLRSPVQRMRSCITGFLCPVLCAALAATPNAARAEPAGAKAGIRVGPGALHPFFEQEIHHHLNPSYDPNHAPSDMATTTRAGTSFAYENEHNEAHARVQGAYTQYLGWLSERTSALSGFTGSLDLRTTLNKTGALRIDAHETLRRIHEAGNETLDHSLRRTVNSAGAGAVYRPGGGAISTRAYYSLIYQRFDRENSPLLRPADLDSMDHAPELEVAWTYLPRTRLFALANARIVRYERPFNADTNLAGVFVGAGTAITLKLSTLLKIGYGNTFIQYDASDTRRDNFNSFLGQAELSYRPTSSTKLRLGALRNVEPTPLFKYAAHNQAYFDATQVFYRRLEVSLRVAFRDVRFARPVVGASIYRHDEHINVVAEVSHAIGKYVVLSAINDLNIRESNWPAATGGDYGYTTNNAYIRVTVSY